MKSFQKSSLQVQIIIITSDVMWMTEFTFFPGTVDFFVKKNLLKFPPVSLSEYYSAGGKMKKERHYEFTKLFISFLLLSLRYFLRFPLLLIAVVKDYREQRKMASTTKYRLNLAFLLIITQHAVFFRWKAYEKRWRWWWWCYVVAKVMMRKSWFGASFAVLFIHLPTTTATITAAIEFSKANNKLT